jgi:hypothetical protein
VSPLGPFDGPVAPCAPCAPVAPSPTIFPVVLLILQHNLELKYDEYVPYVDCDIYNYNIINIDIIFNVNFTINIKY